MALDFRGQRAIAFVVAIMVCTSFAKDGLVRAMAKKLPLAGLGIDDLLALKSQIDTRIAELAADEVAGLEKQLAQMKALATTTMKRGGASISRPAKKPTTDGRRKPSPQRGKKVPPKYKDPKTGKSWTGRGATPVWMRDYEKAGKKRDDFLIANKSK